MLRREWLIWVLSLGLCLCSYLFSMCIYAGEGPALEALNFEVLADQQVRLQLKMSLPISQPLSFSTNDPDRIILDFPGVMSHLPRDQAKINVEAGVLKRVSTVSTPNKMRVVLDLSESVPYEISIDGTVVYLTLSPSQFQAQVQSQSQSQSQSQLQPQAPLEGYSIKNIDFRGGVENSGRVLVDLSDTKIPVDFKEQGNQILLTFIGVSIPERLQRTFDVTDFGTPVQTLQVRQAGLNVQMTIELSDLSEVAAFQINRQFTVEVKPLSQTEQLKLPKEQVYTGDRVTFNFQDIEVRALLQLISDLTGLNLVASDTVVGHVTLNLVNVPWDQALDIVLKTKGLDKRKNGNVLFIAPTEEIAAREKLILQTDQQSQDLAALQSIYIQVNFAKALDLAKLLKDEKNSLLSSRGNVSVDERTNTLLVQDTPKKLMEVKGLVKNLDIPVKQLLIESRIVFAKDDFDKTLGIRFGSASKMRPVRGTTIGLAGERGGTNSLVSGLAPVNLLDSQRLNTSFLKALGSDIKSQLALSIASLPGGTILDLELQALETEGLGKVVASPRLITSNQKTAYIETGEEIPYLEATSSGAASTVFKKAVLRLEVTPQITPNDQIILDLKVNQDTVSERSVNGTPGLNTREMHTQVLVANGETVVLGGIYQQDESKTLNQVPFLGQLPGIGFLFRDKRTSDKRSELMIFVTPKIVRESLKDKFVD